MKKRPGLLVVLSLLFTGICIAQPHNYERKKWKKFSIGFSDGHSYPIGDFGKTDESKLPLSRLTKQDTNSLGGYAQSGFHFDIYSSYMFVRYAGIMVSVGGNDIGYDINTLNSQYMPFFPSGTNTVTTGDNYYIVQYLAGPYLQLPLNKKFSIEFKALAGLTNTNYPSLTYISLSEAAIYRFPSGNALGYNIGTGIKFTTGNGYIGLHLNINYAGSTIDFSSYSVSTYSSTNNYVGTITCNTHENLAIQLLQIAFSFSIEL